MQCAWFNHLSVIRGAKDASLFKDLILNLQQNPDLVTNVKQQLLARKLLSSPAEQQQHMMTQQPPPFLQHLHCPPPSQPPPLPPQPQQPQLNEKPPIMAQDLEAMLLRESRQSGPPPPHYMSSQFMGVDSLLEDSSSLNEVLKNDPILSEILHQSDESSPDSGWGSVSSILNSKPNFETEMSNKQQKVVSESSRSGVASSSYVPLYLRRAGMNTSTDDISTGFSEIRIVQKQEDPLTTFGRFTQEPVVNSFFPPQQIPMFQRQSSASNSDPFTGSSSFIGSSSTTSSAATPSDGKSGSSKPPQLTYANVLRNPQLLRESNDPLTRIRNLGTQGSREVDRDGPGSNPQQPKLFSYFGGGQWWTPITTKKTFVDNKNNNKTVVDKRKTNVTDSKYLRLRNSTLR